MLFFKQYNRMACRATWKTLYLQFENGHSITTNEIHKPTVYFLKLIRKLYWCKSKKCKNVLKKDVFTWFLIRGGGRGIWDNDIIPFFVNVFSKFVSYLPVMIDKISFLSASKSYTISPAIFLKIVNIVK